MKLLFVEDYQDFECIGSKCPITCCGGRWNIFVDSDSAEYYKKVEGDFGERLRNALEYKDDNYLLKLNEEGNCSFLDEEGLCDIYKELGPDKMCIVCKTYPRHHFQVGDILFCYMTNSCPEVTRRILQRQEPLQILLNDSDNTGESKTTDWQQFNYAVRAYTTGMDLLQNRAFQIKERIALLLTFCNQFQNMMANQTDPTGLINLFANPEMYGALLKDLPIYHKEYRQKVKAFMIVFKSLISTYSDLPMWKDCKQLVENLQKEELDMDKMEIAFENWEDEKMQLEMEQLWSYRFFVTFMRGFEKNDYYDRMVYETVLCSALYTYSVLIEVEFKLTDVQEKRILFYSMCSRTDHSQNRKTHLEELIKDEKFEDLGALFAMIS